jgi:hypothetical protein
VKQTARDRFPGFNDFNRKMLLMALKKCYVALQRGLRASPRRSGGARV